jgi:hypothetical protein
MQAMVDNLKRQWIGVVALVLVLSGGALALGDRSGRQVQRVVDAKGRVTACYIKQGKHKGDVRLLVKGKCKGKEKKIKWAKQGPTGKTGATGPRGPAGATDVVVRRAQSTPGTAAGNSEYAEVMCEGGEVAVGGGGFPSNAGGNSNVTFFTSFPIPTEPVGQTPTGWKSQLVTTASTVGGSAVVFAICASP